MSKLSKRLRVAGVLLCSLVSLSRSAGGQELCRGDVNDDGIVDVRDAAAMPAVFFDAAGVDPQTAARADANDDGVVSGADVVAVLRLNGLPCVGGVTPTPSQTTSPSITGTRPSATPTPTPTPTLPPTTTFTPSATPTPTTTCSLRNLSLGTTNGELTTSDCQRDFSDGAHYVDAYSLIGTPGQAITIDAAGTAADQPMAPYVVIFDAGGQFQRVDGSPPIEFVVTSSQPYIVYITSKPMTTMQLGTYQVTVSARACPTPIALTLPVIRAGTLTAADCPDPVSPTIAGESSAVDTYTFTVTQVPTNLQIIMRQTNYAESIDPVFSVIGPDGYELFDPTFDDDEAPALAGDSYPGADAGARFLATVPGTYTVIAGGNGALGSYTLSLLTPGNPVCAPKVLGTIPSTSQLSKTGQLFGDYSKGCGPPLPIPGISDDVPEPNSGADLYTFTAAAGDVISVELDSDDEPHLFLYGPASAGNPRVAQDDYNQSGTYGSAQLAATLLLPGTYTIVAANNNPLTPPDPNDPTDQGDIIGYTLYLQKCALAGALTVGAVRSSTFTPLDCVGFGGLPFRSYAFTGSAGQFVSVSMTSSDVDAAVRLLGPDGSQVYNDDDLFDPSMLDARVNRILPVDGTYLVELSSSLFAGPVDLTSSPGFSVQVQTCPTTTALPGTVSGAFQTSDCELTPGRKYDVYTFAGPAAAGQRAASIVPPTNGCVLGLYAEGLQTPDNGCSNTDLLEFPAVTAGTYGFAVAANDETVRGAYALQFRNCPLSTLAFGSNRNGSLSSGSCTAADGVAADWYLMRGAADLVNFNSGVSGEVTPGFGGSLTDFAGGFAFIDSFSDDSSTMLPLGRDLASLIKVSGPTPGSYTLSIDPASLRQ